MAVTDPAWSLFDKDGKEILSPCCAQRWRRPFLATASCGGCGKTHDVMALGVASANRIVTKVAADGAMDVEVEFLPDQPGTPVRAGGEGSAVPWSVRKASAPSAPWQPVAASQHVPVSFDTWMDSQVAWPTAGGGGVATAIPLGGGTLPSNAAVEMELASLRAALEYERTRVRLYRYQRDELRWLIVIWVSVLGLCILSLVIWEVVS